MNIIACVKQVPDTEAQIKVKADGSGIEDGQIKWVMNPYDEYGVEEALRLKEKNGGDVTIVSVGPARSMETIRTALAMGADKGIHICDAALDNADAFRVVPAEPRLQRQGCRASGNSPADPGHQTGFCRIFRESNSAD